MHARRIAYGGIHGVASRGSTHDGRHSAVARAAALSLPSNGRVARLDAGRTLLPNGPRHFAALKRFGDFAELDELLRRTLRPIYGEFFCASRLVAIQEIQRALPFCLLFRLPPLTR